MMVNGREIDPSKLGHATTYVSQDLTNKFYHLDRIMFAMSPFMTDEESWKLLEEAEKRATSKLENNWTAGDCLNFCKDTLGHDRWAAMEMMWELESQNAVLQLFKPEELREAWINKLTMCEVEPEVAALNLGDHICIKTTKEKTRKIIIG